MLTLRVSLLLLLSFFATLSVAQERSAFILDLTAQDSMLPTHLDINEIFHRISKDGSQLHVETTLKTGSLPRQLIFQSKLIEKSKVKRLIIRVNNEVRSFKPLLEHPSAVWVPLKRITNRKENVIQISYQIQVDNFSSYFEINESLLVGLSRYREDHHRKGWDLRQKEAISYGDIFNIGASVKLDSDSFVIGPSNSVKKDGQHVFLQKKSSGFSLIFFKKDNWKRESIDILGTKFDMVLPKNRNVISFVELRRTLQKAWPSIFSLFPALIEYVAVFENPNEPLGGGPFGESILGLGAMNVINPEVQKVLTDLTGYPMKSSTKSLISAIYKEDSRSWEKYLIHIVTHELMHLIFGLKFSNSNFPQGSHGDALFLGLGVLYDSLIAQSLTGMTPPIYEFPACRKFYENEQLDQGLFYPDTSSDYKFGLLEFHRRNCYSHTRAFHVFSQVRDLVGAEPFDVLIQKYLNQRGVKSGFGGYKNGLRPIFLEHIESFENIESDLKIKGTKFAQ